MSWGSRFRIASTRLSWPRIAAAELLIEHGYGKAPQKLGRAPGHWKEWLDACRGGKAAGSNFADHAAHLAEVVLLGNIAIRMNQKLEWDAANMKFPNCPEADKFVNPPYREGFTI